MKRIALVASLILLLVVGIASASSLDKGRRLAGPFCISLNTGVIRSVAITNQCRPGERRAFGQPDNDKTSTLGGATGATGPAGVGSVGATGAVGPQGPAGPAGSSSVTANTLILCLVPEKGNTKTYSRRLTTGEHGPSGASGASGATGDVRYDVLLRACNSFDNGVTLTVLTP